MSTVWPPLCIADDATFWAWRRWPEFARWPDQASTLVVVPLAGLADWGLGHPLDAEETVLLSVLQAASALRVASREATTRCLRGATSLFQGTSGVELFSSIKVYRFCTGTYR